MKDSDVFNLVNPVVGISKYPGGVIKVKRVSKITGRFQNDTGRKGKAIMKFSPKSMARLVATVNATPIQFNSFLTLTFPRFYPKDGHEAKQAMNYLLTMMRGKFGGQYLWFLEFQKRGAPHFHILSTKDAITPRMRVLIAEWWVGKMSGSDWFVIAAATEAAIYNKCDWEVMGKAIAKAYFFTLRRQTWELLRDKDGAKKYATKYATKEYQKTAPANYSNVGRFWGCSKEVSLGDGVYEEMDETRLRQYLEATDHATKEWDVLPKFLFGVKQELPIGGAQP